MIETKQQGKRVAKGKLGKAHLMISAVALVALIVIIVGVTPGKSGEGKNSSDIKISTPYIDLLLPKELESVVTNDESTYGNIYTRAFYMNYGGAELPLWRIDFGDSHDSEWIGVLKTKQGDISISVTVFVISEQELAALDEEGAKLYSECMQGYSVMLDGIMSDSRFTSERPVEVGDETTVKLTYWKVKLPDTMVVSESSTGGNYEAVFSGIIAGAQVPLYRVSIGEKQLESLLGYYKVDGAKKPVSVETYDLSENSTWQQSDFDAAYHMMDTINDVIAQITSSKQFSEFNEE